MALILWIISGIIAGWLAGLIVRGGGYGPLGDFLIGLVGGLVGGFLAGMISLQPTNGLGHILVAALGGALFVWVLRLLQPGAIDA